MTMTMDHQTTIRTHKGIGIASFIIGIACLAVVLALLVTAGVMAKDGKLSPELTMLVGVGMMAACFVDLIGIALGFVGAVDRTSKKIYPVLGIVLNVIIVMLFAALLAIGLSIKAA